MKKTMLGASALAGLALASSAALADQKTYDFKNFDSVSVSAGIHLVLTAGGDYSIRAEGDEDALDKLDIKLRGDKLDIGRKPSFGIHFGRHNDITVTVSMPKLVSLDASSGSDADASGVAADHFELDASSGAGATISGECDSLNIDVSSGADVDARDFKCKSADADISSGGDATIFASKSVSADASSGGSLKVRGEPQNVNIDRSSGGSVTIVK